MSSNSPIHSDNQEIDLTQIGQKVNGIYEGLLSKLFRFILFIKENIILFIVLFVVGAGIGYYLDKKIPELHWVHHHHCLISLAR